MQELWQKARLPLQLVEKDVHVFLADLDFLEPAIQPALSFLSAEERQRGSNYFFDHDRKRFLSGRTLLRLLLGHYAQVPPQSIQFTHNSYGKPALVLPHVELQFNVSNSAELALLAFTRNIEVGADVEKIRPEFASEAVAEKYFSPDEAKAVSVAFDSIAAFYECWTRKEAYIKAKGQGLSMALDSFAVSLTIPPKLLYSRPFPHDVEQFAFYAPDVGPKAKAAVAAARPENSVTFYSVDQELVKALILDIENLIP